MPAKRKARQSAAKTTAGSEHRLTIVLDMRVALEALLINALHKSPTARRQEWLRRVLIQGFRAECQGVRALMTGSPGAAVSQPRLQGATVPRNGNGDARPKKLQMEVVTANHENETKPLAQLRNTIG